MLHTIADILARQPTWLRPARERAPVRRHSHERHHCEAGFWQPISRREAWRIVLAAKRFNCARKMFGRRNGPLGHIGIEVLELLANLVDFRSGRLEPAIDYLQDKLGRSRAAIVAALDALRRHGYLDWIRRYVKTGDEGKGHPPRQVSNAYRLVLPAAAAVSEVPAPLPEDVTTAKGERRAEVKTQQHEQDRQDLDGSPLGASLARLGQNIRKFTERPESESALEFRKK